MEATRSFPKTIEEQPAKEDFRRDFLREAVSNTIAGDQDVGTRQRRFNKVGRLRSKDMAR